MDKLSGLTILPVEPDEYEEEPEMRTDWVPMCDSTGLIIAVAWKNNEKLAWQLFMDDPMGNC